MCNSCLLSESEGTSLWGSACWPVRVSLVYCSLALNTWSKTCGYYVERGVAVSGDERDAAVYWFVPRSLFPVV